MAIVIGGKDLTIKDVVEVARNFAEVKLDEGQIKAIEKSKEYVDNLVKQKKKAYGITTGFGDLCDVFIDAEDTEKLQTNIIRSHSAGVGRPLPIEVVRAITLLRAHALSKGHSGVKLETIQTLIEMLNKKVHPVVPEKGSLGASGDLAPLAHLTLVMLGEGEAFYEGVRISGKDAMIKAGIEPIKLGAKEGLALVNGTQVMCGESVLIINDSLSLIKYADAIAAMTIEALGGSTKAFDSKIHDLRPHKGQKESAKNILNMLEGSEIAKDIGKSGRTQDAYSLRCTPQVHGASRSAILHAMKVIVKEMNSVTDNPLIFPDDDEVISGGNFHGQFIALAMDYVSIALAEFASISERRINRMMDGKLSGLPPFMIENAGLNSGMMIAHYTAASLVSENKTLCHPASVDSIPVSAEQEDHVSMGSISVRKTRHILENVWNVLAIEIVCAAQGAEFHEEQRSKKTTFLYNDIRKSVKPLTEDRVLSDDIHAAKHILKDSDLLVRFEKEFGKLM